MTDRGFVLAHRGAFIFVSAPATVLEAVEAGEEVRVRSKLSRLGRYGAGALDRALAADEPGQPPGSPDAGDVPLEVGDPYLLLRAIEASR